MEKIKLAMLPYLLLMCFYLGKHDSVDKEGLFPKLRENSDVMSQCLSGSGCSKDQENYD